MVYSWLKNIQYTLLPGCCVLCADSTERNIDLCTRCETTLSEPWARCQHCALPCPIDVAACGHCSTRAFHFNRCEALAPYQAPIDQLIGAFKHRRKLAPGKILAYLLAKRLTQRYRDDDWPDHLIPVPLHWRRQWRRGFNQSHYLATQLSSHLHIPVAENWLVRHRATPSQQGLNRRQRQANLQHAFLIKQRPTLSSHVALIDDVLTTGSTCNLLATLLLEQGVERVDVWCLARTASKSHHHE
jgi:ComF family protein